MTSHKGERFIFIGGAARSGTTLLQNILDTHPDIFGAPELHLLEEIVSMNRKLHGSRDLSDPVCGHAEVDEATRTMVNELLLPLAERNHCALLSEKTPNNVLVFPQLLELFPEAKFLFMVRDPRAVVASMFEVGRRGKEKGWRTPEYTRSIFAAIEYIERCMRAGTKAMAMAPEKVFPVVYERLVADPTGETREICRFLKIDWTEEMTRPGSKKHPGETSITNDVWYTSKLYNRDPDPSGTDKWRSQLSWVQQKIVTAAMNGNKTLADLGYEVAGESSGMERTARKAVRTWKRGVSRCTTIAKKAFS